MRTANNSSNFQPDSLAAFHLVGSEEYKKGVGYYTVSVNSGDVAESFDSLNALLPWGGYSCEKTLTLTYQEKKRKQNGEEVYLALQQSKNYTLSSSENRLQEKIIRNHLNYDPQLQLKQRIYCRKYSRKKTKSFSATWNCHQKETFQTLKQGEKAENVDCTLEEKVTFSSFMSSGTKSAILSHIKDYKMSFDIEYSDHAKVFDFSNCAKNHTEKPFYMHITGHLGHSYTNPNNEYEFSFFIDDRKLQSTMHTTDSGLIKSSTGFYGLAVEYCPKIPQDFVRFRMHALRKDRFSNDELYVSKLPSVRLVRGEEVEYELDDLDGARSEEKKKILVTVYDQNVDLNNGESIETQIQKRMTHAQAVRNRSELNEALLNEITLTQKEFSTCSNYMQEDLSLFFNEKIENSIFSKDIDSQKIKTAMEKAQGLELAGDIGEALSIGIGYGMGHLGRPVIRSSQMIAQNLNIYSGKIRPGIKKFDDIDAWDVGAGFGTLSIIVGGAVLTYHLAVKGQQKGDEDWMDFLNSYSDYQECTSPEASKKHFESSLAILEKEAQMQTQT